MCVGKSKPDYNGIAGTNALALCSERVPSFFPGFEQLRTFYEFPYRTKIKDRVRKSEELPRANGLTLVARIIRANIHKNIERTSYDHSFSKVAQLLKVLD